MPLMTTMCRCLEGVMWSLDDTSSMASCLFSLHACFCSICFFFIFLKKLRTLYAIRTTNATDRHLLYSPWDTDVLSSVQMIATTCVVALWLSIEWPSNHIKKIIKKRFYFTNWWDQSCFRGNANMLNRFF